MRRLWVVLFFFWLQSVEAEPRTLTVNSRVSSVTVFADRALVTREASAVVDAGLSRIVFADLPASIDPASVQAKGTGNALLRDVRFETVFSTNATDELRKKALDDKQKVEDDAAVLNDQRANLEREQSLIERLSNTVGNSSDEEGPGRLDLKEWPTVVEFYRKKIDSIAAELRSVARAQRETQERLQKIDNELAKMGAASKQSNQVSILLDSRVAGSVSMQISYVVHGPSWMPSYELRVDSDKGTMQIGYFGVVRQASSESWDNVALKLSTAQPEAGGAHPELQPWRVGFVEALENRRQKAKAATGSMDNVIPMEQMMDLQAQAPGALAAPLGVEQATVSDTLTASLFEIPAQQTIKNDNQSARVPVGLTDLKVAFRHSAVPKLVPAVFLKAKAINSSEWALLPGTAQVFLDGNFVSSTQLELIPVGSEFWTFLGTDNQVSVKRELVNRLHETVGLIDKEERYVYEYLIKLKNQKKAEIELVLWDQVPIPDDESIHIEFIEPAYRKDSDTLKKNQVNNLEWLLKLKPGEEQKIPFKFAVNYPHGKAVLGLQ